MSVKRKRKGSFVQQLQGFDWSEPGRSVSFLLLSVAPALLCGQLFPPSLRVDRRR